MLACGMEVILVKVAGVGLGVDIVGKNLRDIMPLLRRLVCLSPCSVVEIQTDGQESRYGSHPAGEGGEYETLTLSTPLFSHTIELEDAEVVVTDPEPYPVAYLRVPGGKLVKKENWVRPGQEELRRMLGLDGVEVGSEGWSGAIGRTEDDDSRDKYDRGIQCRSGSIIDRKAFIARRRSRSSQIQQERKMVRGIRLWRYSSWRIDRRRAQALFRFYIR
jgi:hypothetical protein